MSQDFLPEGGFIPQQINEITIRLNDVEYACGLLRKAEEIRQTKLTSISYSCMTPEQQAAAAISGIFPGSIDLYALGVNGIKELFARSFERTANGILED